MRLATRTWSLWSLGLSPRIEGEEMKVNAEGFAGGDRTLIDLPRPQEELLEASSRELESRSCWC